MGRDGESTDRALAMQHLDLLQGAIDRIGGQSFLIKGWNVTLATAIGGFSVKEGGASVAALALIPILLLWWLDAYYLSLERSFRSLFKAAAQVVVAGGTPTLDMTPTVHIPTVFRNSFRPAVVMVHLPLLLLMVALAFGLFPTPS